MPSNVIAPIDPTVVSEANAAHAAAEKTHGKDIAALSAALAESRTRIADAANKALAALGDLIDAERGHDQLVREGSAKLLAQGLPVNDASLGVEWLTGGAPNGVVRIRGSWWLPIPAGAVVMRAVHGAARSRYPDRHQLCQRLARYPGVDQLEARPDSLVKQAPVPSVFGGA